MSEQKKVVIIGGVAGGASAAAKARRISEKAEIILFERGEYISFANCGLPYHIGGTIDDRRRLLVQTPQSMQTRFRIDVRTHSEVIAINREKKEITVRETENGNEYIETYDTLVLSPGAEPNRFPIPGIDSKNVYTLRSMNDMDAIMNSMNENKTGQVVVVGGGYIGLEVAEALRQRGTRVTLVELAPQVMVTADPEMTALIKHKLIEQGVNLKLNTSVASIRTDGDITQVELSNGETVSCGLVVFSVGVRPDIAFARDAGLEIGERGGIVVDEHMRTSDPDIFAVGDAVEVTDLVGGFQAVIPLAGPANRQGRIAADNIFGRDSVYKKTQGTAICKVFDATIAMTGMNEKGLKRIGRKYEKIYVHPADHATYYPGASPISLKLLFDPENGTILGAQAVGFNGIDKRIDVLAVAIRAGMTVYDLEHLELAYAPPYGSAKDPVNFAGFAAANILRGDVDVCHYEDVITPGSDRIILDVRTKSEFKAGTVPDAVNISVDDLRDHLDELPKDKEILVICQVGLRGYLACRILKQHGFKCRNFSGGYQSYLDFVYSMAH
jgi:NADPH-dependent 2,4-dienoyl-CoA reductase/sulfur reductase-like enzyme/rhodanese-related sulfurtransferase